jgi:dienelactone hydrolase
VSAPEAIPFWFGPEERRLFGWLHRPETPSGAGVVLCAPLGYEVHTTYRTYRVLAERLAATGFTALRFDYDGTGDSVGDETDPGRVGAWIVSIRTAVAEVRATGVTAVAVVGLRMGATLAACALGADEHEQLDAMVLWDPCVSGKRFLRELTMLERARVGESHHPPSEDGAVEVAGSVFTAETATDMSGLDLAALARPPAARVLAVVRPDRPLPDRVVDALGRGALVDSIAPAAGEQERLIDTPIPLSAVPVATLDAVVEWLAPYAANAPALGPDSGAASRASVAVVGTTADGRPVVERFLRLGPVGLFGIETTVSGNEAGPVVVCTNSAKVHHIGQNRVWVPLARRWAAAGARVVRIDVSGIGDSPVRPGEREDDAYSLAGIDDIREVAEALVPADPHSVSLVGLCSGAYLAVDVAAAFPLRSIGAVNPNLNYRPEALLAGINDERRSLAPTRSSVKRLVKGEWGAAVRDRLPASAWYALDRMGVHRSPARGLERAADNGVEVVLVYGDQDHGLAQLQERARMNLSRLQRRPRFRLELVEGLDHAMLLREPRERVADVLTAHVERLVAERRPPG